MTTSSNSPLYHAFHVKDGFFTKIGAAWKSKSGNALNIRLDLLPPDGRFTLVDPEKRASASTGTSSAVKQTR